MLNKVYIDIAANESLEKSGKADMCMLIFEPGDLPFIGTGFISGSRGIGRTAYGRDNIGAFC